MILDLGTPLHVTLHLEQALGHTFSIVLWNTLFESVLDTLEDSMLDLRSHHRGWMRKPYVV